MHRLYSEVFGALIVRTSIFWQYDTAKFVLFTFTSHSVLCLILTDTQCFFRIQFGDLFLYKNLSQQVTHMEIDLHDPRYILYTTGAAILFLNRDTLRVQTVAGHLTDVDYKDGHNSEARFSKLFGFSQSTPTHLLVPDSACNCIRLVDGKLNFTTPLVGNPDKVRIKDGSFAIARFWQPYKIYRDERKAELYYLSERRSSRFRVINMVAGTVSSLRRVTSFFPSPWGGLAAVPNKSGQFYITTIRV